MGAHVYGGQGVPAKRPIAFSSAVVGADFSVSCCLLVDVVYISALLAGALASREIRANAELLIHRYHVDCLPTTR